MKILFIGGTGTISTAISKLLISQGHELYLVNRGNRNDELPDGAIPLVSDINDTDRVRKLIAGYNFDCVVDFIAYTPADLERDYTLFKEKTKQFIFISSASAYQKPVENYRITEDTPLINPYWQYSRDKIACEEYLMKLYRKERFPITIVRPSYTYDERSVPVGMHGHNGNWSVVKRIIDGKPIIIHGDGTALWTMTHSRDFAKGFVGLIGNRQAIGEAVHITSDETLTWNQIYEAMASAVGKPLEAVYVSSEFLASVAPYDFRGGLWGDKANSVVFDNSKLKRLVPGFMATISFAEGVKETINNVLAHPELQKEDPEFDRWCDTVIDTMLDASRKIKNIWFQT